MPGPGPVLGMQDDRGLGLAWKELMSNVGGRHILTVVQCVKFNGHKEASQVAQMLKNPPAKCRRCGFDP